VWWLSRHPEHTIVYASYSGGFAEGKSRRMMELALRAGIQLHPDIRRASEWRTVQGGGVLAVGPGGGLTGHGANILIVDDPLKNREEAESPSQREKLYDWFTSTAMTRVEPGGSVIVLHTRWHQDDLIGRLSQEDGWKVINLPATDENGNALWPSRWTKKELDKRRKEVGEYDWWSMFMGSPRPRGGALFKLPTYYDHPDINGARMLIACDPAATAKNWADYSVIITACAKLDKDGLLVVDILDVMRAQMEIPELVDCLAKLQRHWMAPIAVEAVGGFRAVPQMLRRVGISGMRVIEVQAPTDKFTRSLPAAAAWNTGRIRLPLRPDPVSGMGAPTWGPWVDPFIKEVTNFTGVGDVHDDQVDALAHLYNTYAEFLKEKAQRGRFAEDDRVKKNLPFGA